VKEHLLLKDALHQYTKDSSKINGALRSSANTGIAPSPDMQQWIDDATYGLDTGLYALGPILGLKLPLHKDEDGLLYRGLTNAPLMRSLYNNYEVGTIIQDAAFFSTTRTKSVVDKSFSSADDPDDNILYKITHSFSGRFVDGISHFKGEDEVLFCPGTRFYVYKSEGNTVWMHEMYDDEESNILARKVITEKDFDEEDDEVVTEEEVDNDDEEDDEVVTEEEVDNDDEDDYEVVDEEEVDEDDEVVYNDNEEEDHHNITVEDVDDAKEEVVDDDGDNEDGHHEVDSDSDGDNHEHKQNDVNDDESFADTCAVLAVGCEDEYPTFVAKDPPSVDFDSGSVWKDGRRRSARLLAKQGGSTPKPLLGSTLDHLGRRRSLRLQQKE
jgi:hypothetical protein